MGGRSGKAKPEKRKGQRRDPRTQGPHLTGALSEERRWRERRREHDCQDLLVRTPFDASTPYGYAHVTELRPRRFRLGGQLQMVGQDWKRRAWARVAAVGREGFQMTVDLKPVLP